MDIPVEENTASDTRADGEGQSVSQCSAGIRGARIARRMRASTAKVPCAYEGSVVDRHDAIDWRVYVDPNPSL
jgi:hypothetical protein